MRHIFTQKLFGNIHVSITQEYFLLYFNILFRILYGETHILMSLGEALSEPRDYIYTDLSHLPT